MDGGMGCTDSMTGTISSSYKERKLTDAFETGGLTEATIDLSAMFEDGVSSSGSFDLRRSRLGSFERLLQAIPIPALLVDKSCVIVFANRACKWAAGEPGTIEGHLFSVLFSNRADGQQAEELLRKVFHERIPLVATGMLGADDIRTLGRIHFRPVRIQKMSMMLVIIEDITASEPISR